MAGDFNFRFDDASRFAAKMAAAPKLVEQEMTRSVDRLALQGEREAKGKVPVRTGHLRRSIATKPATFAGGTARASFGTATVYAKQVEYGGTIRAKNAPFLVFMGKDGHLVKVKSVTQKGTPYMGPAKKAVEQLMPGELRRAMQRIIAELEG